jgi:hypothetical protein
MKNKFEKIEYGLRLLKEEYEKIDVDGVDIIDKIEKHLKNGEKRLFFPLKIKYAFLSLATFLLLINIFISFNRMNSKTAVKNLSENLNMNKNLIVKSDSVAKKDKVFSKDKKIKKVRNTEEKKDIEIGDEKNKVLIIETIEFTEEINKIVNLFKVDLNMEGENVEI